jgi:hypothetical protein
MEVSPYLLYVTGDALRDLATELPARLSRERAGPGDPAWSADVATRALVTAWDGYLSGLAGRLAEAGDRLDRAADRYAAADGRAADRFGHRSW